jgi:HK97 family phage major capsid protein
MGIDFAEREFEAYRKDDHEARSILEAAGDSDLTPEQSERFEKLLASASGHKARAEQLLKADSDAKSVAEMVRSRETAAAESPRRAKGDAELRSAIREALSVKARGDSFVETALEFRLPESDEVRALADFSDGTKVYVNDFRSTVAVYMRTMSPWLQTSTVINGTDGRPLNLPVISADPTGYSPGEGTAITEATPTLGTAVATPVSYKALAYISQEFGQDEQTDLGILTYIARTQGRSLGLMAGSAFTSTVVAAATNGGTATGVGGGGGTSGTAVVTFLGYEDLLTLKYGIAAPYRMVGSWVMANSVILKAKKFKDGQGQYLWQPAIALGQPDMFDGNAVYEDPYLAAAASATKSVLFGDLSQVVVKQLPLRVATSDQFKFDTDQIALKAVYRAGAALPDAAAIRYLISANT